MSKQRVLVDTNIILEAIRIGCWTLLCEQYAIETVEKCVEEALTGNHLTSVQRKLLIEGLSVRHKPNKRAIAELVLSHSQCQGLDDGELHLFAWIHAQKIVTLPFISTADKAAVRATHRLGWFNTLISLEELLQKSGISKAKLDELRGHFRTSWLSKTRTNSLLEIY